MPNSQTCSGDAMPDNAASRSLRKDMTSQRDLRIHVGGSLPSYAPGVHPGPFPRDRINLAVKLIYDNPHFVLSSLVAPRARSTRLPHSSRGGSASLASLVKQGHYYGGTLVHSVSITPLDNPQEAARQE